MFHSVLTICLVSLFRVSSAWYTLEDDYSPQNFFNMFTFFTDPDPTHGFVQYVDEATALSTGLINTTASSVYIGVDTTNVTPSGRPSVRITSNKSYNHSLFILDLDHMPFGCGTWPAYWTVGPNWPNSGEIDIIEGVNSQTTDLVTLHTGPNCSITNNNNFYGVLTTTDCYVNAPNQSPNAGCSIHATNPNTYGAGFNANDGGVYATEWTSAAISTWFFPRGAIPADIRWGRPNPRRWGEPLAQHQGACNIDAHVFNQQIVFDDTFCGDWGGNVWQYDAVCAPLAPTCNQFVANNPGAFTEAYWQIRSLKVYQDRERSSAAWQGQAPVGVDHDLPPWIASLAPIPPQGRGHGHGWDKRTAEPAAPTARSFRNRS